jgi:CBS domain-containing protein
MKVREVMTKGVEVIHPQAGLPEAAMTMRKLDVGSLPVVKDGRLEGIVTDRDIAVRAVAEGRNLATTLVGDVMSRGVAFVQEEDEVETASRLMAERQVRRVPVFGPDRKLTGILALADLAIERRAQEAAGEALEGVSAPAKPGH